MYWQFPPPMPVAIQSKYVVHMHTTKRKREEGGIPGRFTQMCSCLQYVFTARSIHQ